MCLSKKTKTIAILFILLLTFKSGYTQQDYLINLVGDTLKGKVVRGNLHNNWVTLKSENKKQKIYLEDIKEWKSGKNPIMVWKDTSGKRTTFFELVLKIDGDIKLLSDINLDWSYKYVIKMNDEYYYPTPSNITNHIWQKLLKCEQFSAKYNKYSNEEAGRLFNGSKEAALKEIVQYYNAHCKNLNIRTVIETP